MRTPGAPAALKVAALRGDFGVTAPSEEIRGALDELQRRGQVRRNLNGSWSLTSPPPPAVATPPQKVQGAAKEKQPPSVALPTVADRGIPTQRDEAGVIDPSQRAVIREPCSARQVVNAGPGFGKTAVACARVAWLLDQGTAAPHILLLSFTRTAVREMRGRIAELARGNVDVHGVEVRTIDSFMWRVRTGFAETATEATDYAESIEGAAALFDALTPDARAYIERFAHVLVDEAQDLVGGRAALVARMLRCLRPEAGWTIFFDPAQAIYEWSEDEGDEAATSAPFADLLDALTPPPTRRSLEHLHRTQDPALRALLLGARRVVLETPNDAYPRLRSTLEARVVGEELSVQHAPKGLQEQGLATAETLILLRRRAELMELSSQLSQEGTAHRLRLGGMPHLGAPWVAPTLNEAFRAADDLVVDETAFREAWALVGDANPWLVAGWEVDTAWRLLRRLGRGVRRATVDIGQVAKRLAVQTLPDDVSRRELGTTGPLVSTIHGSKGRESTHALLLLTAAQEECAEEARVLYVGLSRAKERFDVRTLRGTRWAHLKESGRAWHRAKSGNRRVEVGRAGDFDLARTLEALGEKLATQQDLLARFDGTVRAVDVRTGEAPRWIRHAVWEGTPLAALSVACEKELWQVARQGEPGASTPTLVKHLRWFDLGSVALSGEAAVKLNLPEPWNSTRLFLMPVIVGPGVIFGAKHDSRS